MNEAFTILCGGKSRRMGEDKATLIYQGETLLARHIRLASNLGMQVQIAGGGTTYPLPDEVIQVADKLPDRCGPLSALAGALNAAALTGKAGSWLFPIDTLVTPKQLLTTLEPKRPAAAVMIVAEGRPQPLFAWYSTALLPRIEQWLATGIRQMMPLAALSDMRHVVMPDSWHGLDNFNTPAEWQTAQQLIKEHHD